MHGCSTRSTGTYFCFGQRKCRCNGGNVLQLQRRRMINDVFWKCTQESMKKFMSRWGIAWKQSLHFTPQWLIKTCLEAYFEICMMYTEWGTSLIHFFSFLSVIPTLLRYLPVSSPFFITAGFAFPTQRRWNHHWWMVQVKSTITIT